MSQEPTPVTPPPWWASWTLQMVVNGAILLTAIAGLIAALSNHQQVGEVKAQVEDHGELQREIRQDVKKVEARTSEKEKP